MKILVYTVLTGAHSQILPRIDFEEPQCSYWAFLDKETARSLEPMHTAPQWNLFVFDQVFDNPFLSSRFLKMHSPISFAKTHCRELFDQLESDFDYIVYLDADIDIIGSIYKKAHFYAFPELAFYSHNETTDNCNCIYDEAERVIQLNKADTSLVRKQVRYYVRQGYPKQNGMICGGVIFRKNNSEKVDLLLREWWKWTKRFPTRDQLSFGFAYWKLDRWIKITLFSSDIRDNETFRIRKRLR